jgi:hypothetical protein
MQCVTHFQRRTLWRHITEGRTLHYSIWLWITKEAEFMSWNKFEKTCIRNLVSRSVVMNVAILWDIAPCTLLRNVGSHTGYTAAYPTRWQHLYKEHQLQVHNLFAYLVTNILHRRGLNWSNYTNADINIKIPSSLIFPTHIETGKIIISGEKSERFNDSGPNYIIRYYYYYGTI